MPQVQLDMGVLDHKDINRLGTKRTKRQIIRSTYHGRYSIDKKQLELDGKACYTDGKFMKLLKAGQNYLIISLTKKGRQKFEKEPTLIVDLINKATYEFITEYLVPDGIFNGEQELLQSMLEPKYDEDGVFSIFL